MQNFGFSILITTKDRKNDLAFTLSKIQYLLNREDVECLICDDGSNDTTWQIIQNFPDPRIKKFKNNKNESIAYLNLRNISLK